MFDGIPRLEILAAGVVVARGDLRALTAPVLAALPERSVLLLLAALTRRLALTRPLVLAFSACGHDAVETALRALIADADAGIVGGGLQQHCRD